MPSFPAFGSWRRPYCGVAAVWGRGGSALIDLLRFIQLDNELLTHPQHSVDERCGLAPSRAIHLHDIRRRLEQAHVIQRVSACAKYTHTDITHTECAGRPFGWRAAFRPQHPVPSRLRVVSATCPLRGRHGVKQSVERVQKFLTLFGVCFKLHSPGSIIGRPCMIPYDDQDTSTMPSPPDCNPQPGARNSHALQRPPAAAPHLSVCTIWRPDVCQPSYF